MVISNMSLFLKYFICIDAIALDYRINLLVWYLLHQRNRLPAGAIPHAGADTRETEKDPY